MKIIVILSRIDCDSNSDDNENKKKKSDTSSCAIVDNNILLLQIIIMMNQLDGVYVLFDFTIIYISDN